MWRDVDAVSSPGLTFCGLTPEDHDLDMADKCQDEKFFRMLAQETPQVHCWLPVHLPQALLILSVLGAAGRAAHPFGRRGGRAEG